MWDTDIQEAAIKALAEVALDKDSDLSDEQKTALEAFIKVKEADIEACKAKKELKKVQKENGDETDDEDGVDNEEDE